MRSGFVITAVVAGLVPLMAACGATTVDTGQHRPPLSTGGTAAKDPTALNPCTFVTTGDLKAVLRARYGSAVDSGPATAAPSPSPTDTPAADQATPSDGTDATATAAATDTPAAADTPSSSASSSSVYANFRFDVSSAPNSSYAPGFSKLECDVTAHADEVGGPSNSLVYRLVLRFVTLDTYQSALGDAHTTKTISGADGAVVEGDLLLLKNGLVVAATGGLQGDESLLTAMLGRLPA